MVFTNKLKWFGNGEKCDITNKNFLLQQQVFILQQLHIRLRQIKRNNKFYYDYYCYNNTNWKKTGKSSCFPQQENCEKWFFLKSKWISKHVRRIENDSPLMFQFGFFHFRFKGMTTSNDDENIFIFFFVCI